MAGPAIATKLYVPKLRPGLVTRPRLRERLRRGAESRLTLLSAPAGFGKTTLLAEWLDRLAGEDHSVAWLSLDPQDSEPASFWTYLVAALRTAVPGIGSTALELLVSSPVPTEVMLTTLVNELAETPHGVWLVLDDYHLVGSEVAAGMAFVLEHLPPNLHIVISTRADPDLPLSRWRVRGELVEIRAADLRFNLDETARYLNAGAGLKLAVEDVAALEERTEGWIAALQLAALSLQGRDDVRGFIAHFAGDDRYVVDYLVEEVLQHQPEPVREFLLESSILDRLTGPLCDAVTGRDDGADTLVALERANLFLVPLDDRREWYRYHHLFADVLRARVIAEQPDLVPQLHQRASRWYQAHELTQDAIRHALAASDFGRAAFLMELAVPAVRRDRQEAVLLGWLKALPDDAVRRSPVLSVFHGSMLMAAGDLDGVEPRLADAERALAAPPGGSARQWAETEELRTLPATIAVYRAALAQARGDVTATARHARQALDLAGPDDHLARGSGAGLLGLASWAQGDVATGIESFTQAVASLHAAGNIVDELSGTVVLADMWLTTGRPSQARRLYERALQAAESRGAAVARATAALHVGLSEIDREVDDLASASWHLERAEALGEGPSMTETRYRWYVSKSRVAESMGQIEEAITLLDTAEQLYRPGFFPDVRPIAAMRARVWIRRGDLVRAAGWAADRGVSAADDARYLSEFDHLTFLRLLIALHPSRKDARPLDQSGNLVDRLLDAAETSGRAGSLLEIRMLRALALDAQGHRQQALECLALAFAQAPEPEHHVRLFLDEGPPMMALLRDAQQGGGVVAGHARRLLRHEANGDGDAPDLGDRVAPQVARLVDSLSDREVQVLRLLDTELTGPQIARELFISHNTLRTHTKHIFTKLDVTTRRGAVRRARERGLL